METNTQEDIAYHSVVKKFIDDLLGGDVDIFEEYSGASNEEIFKTSLFPHLKEEKGWTDELKQELVKELLKIGCIDNSIPPPVRETPLNVKFIEIPPAPYVDLD